MHQRVDADLKDQVKTFWEDNPCDVKDTGSPFDAAYFDALSRQRYTSHPYIPEFAEFERWCGKRVLEVGVGAGSDFCRWVEAGAQAVGIDLTAQAAQLTTQRLALGAQSATVNIADCEHLPFDDNVFDLCYSFGVLHHTPDTERAIGEVFRVLKPGGQIRIMLYHTMSWVVFKVYLLHGLLALRPFASIDSLLADHMESQGTKAYTMAQAQTLFAQFADVRVQPTLTCYDTWRGYQTREGALFKVAKQLWPAWFIQRLGDRYGWNLLISGVKA
ncbi:MAG: class I SAM-dependent methyltransferase [Candidatus Tectomicrobia bacterium]|nr:class I SAM-dependent methyltransferase [Candidatus Tectomicrobia bacterium]